MAARRMASRANGSPTPASSDLSVSSFASLPFTMTSLILTRHELAAHRQLHGRQAHGLTCQRLAHARQLRSVSELVCFAALHDDLTDPHASRTCSAPAASWPPGAWPHVPTARPRPPAPICQ